MSRPLTVNEMRTALANAADAEHHYIEGLAEYLAAVDAVTTNIADLGRCRHDVLSGWCTAHQHHVMPGERLCAMWRLVEMRRSCRELWEVFAAADRFAS